MTCIKFIKFQKMKREISEPPTPHYNNGILREALIEAHLTFLNAALADFPGSKEGIMLLKIWLRQRKLDQGFGGFTGFHVSMLVAYLISRNQISPVMSSYQVFRSVLHFLAITDMTVNGITLATDPNSLGPTLSEFHSAFQVVFIDPSGFANVFADMTTNQYKQVQHEAQLSMQVWDNPNFDGFHALFMTTKTLVRSFDHVFHISCMSRLQRACNKMKLFSDIMDHNGNYVAAALPYILSILQRGLGERISLLIPVLPQTQEWSIYTDPPQHKDMGLLSFGMLLNTEHSTNILEKGPAADSVQATEFRRFWGNKAELRRFQDGSLCEAVIWDGDSLFEKRLITEKIVKHLLQLHADIPESSVNYVGGLLDRILQVGRKPCRTGEEESLKITHAFDDLNRKLWNLEGLPLTITSVQAAHSSLRHTQVFPPLPMNPDLSFFQKEKLDNSLLPLEEKPCPAYIPALQDCLNCATLALLKKMLFMTYGGVFHKVELSKLQQQHSTFGTTARLAKRWIGAHLLDACLMSDEAVELLVASLFLHPAPFNTPNTHQYQYIRHNVPPDIKSEPDIAMQYVTQRMEKAGAISGRGNHSVVFRSPLDIYDVLIHLNPKRVPRQAQAIDVPTVTFSRGALFSEAVGTKAFMPIVEFDPVSIFLKELRDAFGELALFFCDPNGGLIIAVLWKPQAFSKQTFRASHMNARLVEIGSNGAQTVPNVEAILEDFEILGAGLVEKLEIQTEKWSI
ncbi:NOL6 protein, partial [Polypterus senegalus]